VRAVEAVEALHTAARRYCVDRAAEWDRRYSDLRREEERERRRTGVPDPVMHSYSREALATFPRYHVLHAIQAEVEAFTPADLGSLDEARELLAEAGATANNIFTKEPIGEIELRAIGEERELFRLYVRSLAGEALAQVEPLPFRRTLSREEGAALWHELDKRWGVKGYWYPLDRARDASAPGVHRCLQRRPVLRGRAPTAPARRALEPRRRTRLGATGARTNKEVELAILEPVYTGAEGFWTDGSFDWLIYASHEGSVTVAGPRLLPPLEAAWPAWNQNLYDPSY
jgi:hypothetical protein